MKKSLLFISQHTNTKYEICDFDEKEGISQQQKQQQKTPNAAIENSHKRGVSYYTYSVDCLFCHSLKTINKLKVLFRCSYC